MDLLKSNEKKDALKKSGGDQREYEQLEPNAGSVIQKPYDIIVIEQL